MKRVEFRGERDVTAAGSVSARVRRLAGEAHVVVIEIGAGGVVARHRSEVHNSTFPRGRRVICPGA